MATHKKLTDGQLQVLDQALQLLYNQSPSMSLKVGALETALFQSFGIYCHEVNIQDKEV